MPRSDHDTIIKIEADVGFIRTNLEKGLEKVELNIKEIDGLKSSRDTLRGGFIVVSLAIGAIVAKILKLY